jgi:hypothetical protein
MCVHLSMCFVSKATERIWNKLSILVDIECRYFNYNFLPMAVVQRLLYTNVFIYFIVFYVTVLSVAQTVGLSRQVVGWLM